MRLTALTLPLVLSVVLWGCGGSSKHSPSAPVGQPSAPVAESIPTVRCETAIAGTPSRSLRSRSPSAGPVSIFGGRDFSTLSRASGPRPPGFSKVVKMPVMVEGHAPVTLSIAPRDRSHGRLVAPTSSSWAPYVEVRLVPCGDKARTVWAAGFLLRNLRPITVVVRHAGEPGRHLQVGGA